MPIANNEHHQITICRQCVGICGRRTIIGQCSVGISTPTLLTGPSMCPNQLQPVSHTKVQMDQAGLAVEQGHECLQLVRRGGSVGLTVLGQLFGLLALGGGPSDFKVEKKMNEIIGL